MRGRGSLILFACVYPTPASEHWGEDRLENIREEDVVSMSTSAAATTLVDGGWYTLRVSSTGNCVQ